MKAALHKMVSRLQHKFNVGDTVCDITRPHQLMLITKRDGVVYYCHPEGGQQRRELTYMERDLKRMSSDEVPPALSIYSIKFV